VPLREIDVVDGDPRQLASRTLNVEPMNSPWQQEWKRMQMWLFAGFCVLLVSAVLAWVMAQVGSPQSAIVIGLLGAVVDIACIGRGVWSYIQVLRMRARERAGKPTSISNYEWLLAIALLVIPLGLYTLWFVEFR
jgi:hypothetical protein